MKRNVQNTSKGITLVALVITIIVLLILAGVAINMAINSDGLFGKANEAAEKWNTAVADESDAIDNLLAQIGVINWEKAKAEAVAPTSQDEERNNGVIGIGTDGKPVDMDLWEYEIDETTGGYALNDKTTLTATTMDVVTSGYIGEDFDNINIPQYISADAGETWTPVTNLHFTFYNCTDLVETPQIPTTVTSLRDTFDACTALEKVTNFPDGVTSLWGTFNGCTSLEFVEVAFPEGLIEMPFAFMNCNNLLKVPQIPDSVKNMRSTFFQCINLKTAPELGNNVENMNKTFYYCTNLVRCKKIPNSVKDLTDCFTRLQ